METSFFISWALWEKMSFILALAIVVVFGIAYGKLVWNNRIVKRQECKDVEQSLATEATRQSRRMIETGPSHDIPFGVRAIQSGIQIDGIWISRDSPTIHTELKIDHTRNSSSIRRSARSASLRTSQDSVEAAVHLASSQGQTKCRESESGLLVADKGSISSESQLIRLDRPSYTPRRSSHLRYASHGEINHDEQTLGQIEGSKRGDAESSIYEAYKTQQSENDTAFEPATNNGHSSCTELDVILASNVNTQTYRQRHSLAAQPAGVESLLELANMASSRSFQSTLLIQMSKSEHIQIPLKPFENGTVDPLAASLANPIIRELPFTPPYTRTIRELNASGESQVPLLIHSRPLTPFIPGDLHINKSVRRVNSGFEVLPAGTFGNTLGFEQTGADEDDNTAEKRQSNKLQKKI